MPVSTGIHFSRRATHNSCVGAKSVGAASNATEYDAIPCHLPVDRLDALARLAAMAVRWPELRFDICPTHGGP